MRLVKLTICLIGLVGLIHAQSGALSWSIYQTILVNSTQAPPFTSNVFTNVGQTTHEVVVTLSPQPTRLCPAMDTTQSSLQFSFDGITYTNFGAAINPAGATGLTVLFVGTGAYPRVRFFLGQYDTTDCFVSAFYSGATTNPYTQVIGSANNGTPAPPPVVIGGVGNGGGVQGFAACNAMQGGTIAAGTTAQIIGSVASGNLTTKICSIAISAAVAATATLSTGQGLTCSSGPVMQVTQFVAPLAAGIPFNYGTGIGAVFTGNPGLTFCLQATGNPINYNVSYATSSF